MPQQLPRPQEAEASDVRAHNLRGETGPDENAHTAKPGGSDWAVELGDVIANGAGVSCGALLGLPIRTLTAIL